MNIFNKTHNQLEQLGFKESKLTGNIYSVGCTFYSNLKFNILLKYYPKPSVEIIKEESKKLREELFYGNYNVWNSYFLICVDESASKDFTYLIEKDKKGLRKYVIKNQKDFDRIPFLDNVQESSQFKVEIFDGKNTSSEVESILKHINSSNGTEINFTNQDVNNIVQLVISEVLNSNED